MALLGDPDYKNLKRLTEDELGGMSDDDILYSYIIIKTRFEFNSNVKYPSIPCFMDKDITVYPLNGKAILTGSEYLVARNIGCKFSISDIYFIPFKTNKLAKGEKGENLLSYQPFKDCIKELQALRREHPKGSVDNLIYKAIGNSLYGLITKGISNKTKMDYNTNTKVRIRGNELSNPIMSSWITAYIRSVIGELLHNTSILNGMTVSVTTDGFITNLDNLEDRILSNKQLNSFLLQSYNKVRNELSGNPNALELKTSDVGIIALNTRGQFSGKGLIAATTGFQRRGLEFDYLSTLLLYTINSEDKTIEFVERSLRSGVDLIKRGGSVTSVYKDKTFRMLFDNRRVIIDKPLVDDLRDSKPVQDLDMVKVNRFVSKLPTQGKYNRTDVVRTAVYKSNIDVAVRSFVRALFSKDYNLDVNNFGNYKELSIFVEGFDKTCKLNENTIASLKRRPLNKRKLFVSRDIKVVDFVAYVKTKFPEFDDESFLKQGE